MISMKEKLIKEGYKITKPRLVVLEYFSKKHKPISALSLSKKYKGINRASVYRCLNIFEKIGLLNVEIINKEKIYCWTSKPHHHVVCDKCGYTESIECKHKIENHKNFRILRHQMTLIGLCQKCSS